MADTERVEGVGTRVPRASSERAGRGLLGRLVLGRLVLGRLAVGRLVLSGLVLGRLAVAGLVLAWLVLPVLGHPGAPPVSQAAAAEAWRWPVDPPRSVVRPFAPGATRYAAGHYGADLRAAAGSPVRAVGAGRVTYGGLLAGRGVVVVEHAGGLRTTYEPVERAVRLGQQVRAGDVLGRVTAGHACSPSCLHLGLRRGQEYLDPLSLFGGPPRLLPLHAASGLVVGRPAGRDARGGTPGTTSAPDPREGAAAVRPLAEPTPSDRLASGSGAEATATPVRRVVGAPVAPTWTHRVADGLPGAALAAALLAGGLVLVRRPRPPAPTGGSAGGSLLPADEPVEAVPDTAAAAVASRAQERDAGDASGAPAAEVVVLEAWRARRSG